MGGLKGVGMRFEAKDLDMKLELVSIDKEERVFYPKERVTANFAEKVVDELKTYIQAQRELPESEQDSMNLAYLKFLSWMYKDLDIDWLKDNFNFEELKVIRDWALKGLTGIKKEEQS
jgi:hypothetical protein